MTLLSEIYDVTLKQGNRGAAKLGWSRPTIGEYFMTHRDFVEVLKGYTDNLAISDNGIGAASTNATGSYPISRIFTLFRNPEEWRSNALDTQWVQFQFNEAKTISKISLSADDYYYEKMPTAFTLVASNTGAFTGEQTLLYTGSVSSWISNETKEFTFSNSVDYIYITD